MKTILSKRSFSNWNFKSVLRHIAIGVFLAVFTIPTSAQVTLHLQDFSSGLGAWQAVDIADGSDVWTASSGVATINGYGGADDEDWLISPPFDLNAQEDELLLFDYFDNYNGSLVELYYSKNYNGAGTPASVGSATWTQLPLELIDIYATSCQTTLNQRHPAIDVSGITGTAVNFAFKYTGTSTYAKAYTIDDIQLVSGYYDAIESLVAAGTYCAEIKTAIRWHIARQSERIRYSSSLYDTWDAFLHTDNRLNDSGTSMIVWDMFTDYPSASGENEFDHCVDRDDGSCSGGEGVCYNREHTLPKSWWGGGTNLADTQYVDLHHLVPSDKLMNTLKSNYPPGKVLVASNTGTNGYKVGTNNTYPCPGMKYFEPIDEFKGDYARMFFYMATRYEHIIDGWASLTPNGDCALSGDRYTVYEPWLLDLLSQWHTSDPVSQKEVDRNNAVYAIQGNRNPFIDHPEYAGYIWDDYLGTPCSLAPLPIELLSFQASWNRDMVELEWTTASEIDNSHFVIERSQEGHHWDAIVEMPGAGNSSAVLSYLTLDRFPLSGTSYYRLKQVDFNGESSYSTIRVVHAESSLDMELRVFPSPTHGQVTLLTNMDRVDIKYLRVFSMEGRDCTSLVRMMSQTSGRAILDLGDLKSGIYIIQCAEQKVRVEKY